MTLTQVPPSQNPKKKRDNRAAADVWTALLTSLNHLPHPSSDDCDGQRISPELQICAENATVILSICALVGVDTEEMSPHVCRWVRR